MKISSALISFAKIGRHSDNTPLVKITGEALKTIGACFNFLLHTHNFGLLD